MELNTVIVGDALTVLRQLPDAFVDVTVTSPPCNKSETYVAIACERLKNAEAERARVAAELALRVVRKTFKERKERGEWVGRFRPQPLADEGGEQPAKQIALPIQD